jgi:hypothetical protein
MYNVTIFFLDRTNVRSKLLLLGHLPNFVGHCPMSDSNLQPCAGIFLASILLKEMRYLVYIRYLWYQVTPLSTSIIKIFVLRFRCVNKIQVRPPPARSSCNSDLSEWNHSNDKKGLEDQALKGAWEDGVTFVFHHWSHEKQLGV